MSEPRWIRGRRGRPKMGMPEPSKKGLKCPACGARTVNRDISEEDGWFVEFCVGGEVKIVSRTDSYLDGKVITKVVPCEYWGVGFE